MVGPANMHSREAEAERFNDRVRRAEAARELKHQQEKDDAGLPAGVLERIMEEVARLRSSAGFMDSLTMLSTAEQLESQVRFYRLGYDRLRPPEWAEYFKQQIREKDPDYQKYLELKIKFADAEGSK